MENVKEVVLMPVMISLIQWSQFGGTVETIISFFKVY